MSLSEAEFEAIRDRMVANSVGRAIDMASALRGALTAGRPPAKRSKFGNVKKEIDGHVFDSSAEARRYIELKAMQAAGQIANLELQPRYTLLEAFTDDTGKKHRKIEYVADFRYLQIHGHHLPDRTCVEDVKGHPTEAFKIKWKMAIRKYPDVRFELSR